MKDEIVVFQFLSYADGTRTPASRAKLSDIRAFLVDTIKDESDPPTMGILILSSSDDGVFSDFDSRPVYSALSFIEITKSLEVSNVSR